MLKYFILRLKLIILTKPTLGYRLVAVKLRFLVCSSFKDKSD